MSTAIARPRCRLVRNAPLERWCLGHTDPYAPYFEVEAIDEDRFPTAVLASGPAPECRAVIARVGGIEVKQEV